MTDKTSKLKQFRNVKAARRERQAKIMFWVLLGYFTIEYVRPQYFVPAVGAVRPGLILGVLLIIYSLSSGWKVIKEEPIIQLCLAFIVVIVIWVPFAVNNFWAFSTAKSMLLHVLAGMVPMIAMVRTMGAFKVLVRFWLFVGVYLAFFGLTHGGRGPGSFLADENDLALFLLMTLPFGYFLAQQKGISRGHRLLFYAATGIMVLGIVATNSRGGFVGLTAVIAALVWYSHSRIKAIMIMVVLSVAIIPFVPQSYINEITTITQEGDKTKDDRLFSWGLGWDMFVDNPIVGVGPGNYPWRVQEWEFRRSNDKRLIGRAHGGRAAHSLYFTLIPELGLIGITLYAMIVFFVLRENQVLRREAIDDYSVCIARAITVGFLGFFSSGIFISVLYYASFWYLSAYTIVLRNISGDGKKPTTRTVTGARPT